MSLGAAGNTGPALEGADAKCPMQVAARGANQRYLVCRLVAVNLQLNCSLFAVLLSIYNLMEVDVQVACS